MTTAANSGRTGTGRAADVVARGPEDLLSVVPYELGYLPRESLAMLAARESELLLTARLDLPCNEQGLEPWARSLDAVLDQMRCSAAPDRIYCVLYTDRTRVLDALAETWDADLPVSLCAENFACDHLVFRAAMAAVGKIVAARLDPRDVWIVDESRNHWGTLMDPRRGDDGDFEVVQVPGPWPDAPHWLVPRGGTCEGLRTTPAAAAMVCRGRAIRTAAEARTDHEIMPGPFELESVLGEGRASSLRRSLRARIRELSTEGSGPEAAERTGPTALPRAVVPMVDALERLLSPAVATAERQARTDEDPRPWRDLRARLIDGLDQHDLALVAHRLPLMSGLAPALLAAGWGREAARCWLGRLEASVEGGSSDTALQRVLGDSSDAPDSQRLRAMRLVMTVLEESGEPEVSAAASAANAMIGWYVSLNGQAEHYLRRAALGPVVSALELARSATGRRIVPVWATKSWARREYGSRGETA